MMQKILTHQEKKGGGGSSLPDRVFDSPQSNYRLSLHTPITI